MQAPAGNAAHGDSHNFLVDPKALYQMAEFYQGLDCEVLFGEGVQTQDFNDDALGRALTQADPHQLFADLSAAMISEWDLPPTTEVHSDTSTVTLYGEYSETDVAVQPDAQSDASQLPPPRVARPAHGYSKDDKHDCKQLVVAIRPARMAFRLRSTLTTAIWTTPSGFAGRSANSPLCIKQKPPSKPLFVSDSKAINHQPGRALR